MRSGQILFLFVGVLLVAGAARLTTLELGRGAELRAAAEAQQTAKWPIPAQRGDVLDCKGRVLAGSLRTPSVFVDPALVENAGTTAEQVADVLGLDAEQLYTLIIEKHAAGRRFAWVKRNISEDELKAFNALRREQKLHGFVVRYEPQRVYPYGDLAAAVLGFVGGEQRGLAGVEFQFNDELMGTNGEAYSTVDVRRRCVRTEPQEYVPPQDGASVVLTIDAFIQQRVEAHLKEAFEEHNPEWATAVVMDPRTGEVLAMASLPGFDPAAPIPPGLSEKEADEAWARLRNRVVSDSYEPGSVFKPFIAGPAVQDGLTYLDEVYPVAGPIHKFGSRRIKDVHAYDALPLYKVISKSSNIGMGMLGERVGNERLNEYVRRFGFGDLTGIDLPGEHAGLLQSFSRWTNYSTQSIPIGQEVCVTPLQLLNAFCAYCNDGILMRPRIVRGVIDADGTTREDRSRPVAVRRVLDPEAARVFRMRALVEVVNDGTGKPAQLDDYQVFGKSGTAQVAAPNGGGYISGAYAGSFVAGAPAEDPQLAVMVTIYRPAAGRKYYGSTVAAPAVREILRDTLEYLRVPPSARG